MSLPTRKLESRDLLADVLQALIDQIEAGTSFEHARGAFREVAMRLGFATNAEVMKAGSRALYDAWQSRRLKEIDDLVAQGRLPPSSFDPERSLAQNDTPLFKPQVSSDEPS